RSIATSLRRSLASSGEVGPRAGLKLCLRLSPWPNRLLVRSGPRDSGDGQHRAPTLGQRMQTGLDRGARGHDVVDQNETARPEGLTLAKGSDDVLVASRAVEAGLLRRVPHPLEQPGLEARFVGACQSLSDERGLVVAALGQTPRV